MLTRAVVVACGRLRAPGGTTRRPTIRSNRRCGSVGAMRSVVAAALFAACTPPPAPPDAGPADEIDVAQTPPEGDEALRAWLDEEHFLQWRCHGEIGEPSVASIHGRRRICANDALAEAGDGALPVGAAAVKMLYDDADARVGTTVLRKRAEGDTAASWYWFERTGDATITDAVDAVGCRECHVTAPDEGGREYVFNPRP